MNYIVLSHNVLAVYLNVVETLVIGTTFIVYS